MADNVPITAGSGTNIATDERTIASTTVQIQRVIGIGSSTLANGQVAPTNTAATLLAARETRSRVVFVNHGSVDVYIGIATVTTANGFKLPPGGTLTLHTTALTQAITASGTGSIHYIEEFD
jgi:hypothetical protein